MSLPPESREEAIARLNRSASDLEARTAPPLSHEAAGQAAAGQAWKIIADLFGGVLLGFAISVWMAWRTAQRLMAEANKHGEPKSVPFDDDEDQGA